VISHGVSIGLLRGRYLGLSRSETLSLQVPQGVVYVLGDGRVETLAADPQLLASP
jgi:broad specificity phosphatase PhoE